MNEIPRNNKLFRCCQRSIIIRSAAEQAVEAAKKQFAEPEAIGDWKIDAGLIEIESIEALRFPENGHYRHEPIVDDGKVVGIVSRFDFSGIGLDRQEEETGLWERI
jgi:hypothetical protein